MKPWKTLFEFDKLKFYKCHGFVIHNLYKSIEIKTDYMKIQIKTRVKNVFPLTFSNKTTVGAA